MLTDDFECHFIICNPLPDLKRQILEICETITELPETREDKAEASYLTDPLLSGEEIILLDSYHFRANYQNNNKHSRGRASDYQAA